MKTKVYEKLTEMVISLLGEKAGEVVSNICHITVEARKLIIKFCRTTTDHEVVLLSNISYSLSLLLPSSMYFGLLKHFKSKLARSLLLTCCMNCPITPQMRADLELASYVKEITVMNSSDIMTHNLNLNPFFGEYNESVYYTIDPNPKMAMRIHMIIDQWKEWMSNHLLISETSFKVVPESTSKGMKKWIIHKDDSDPITYSDLDSYYEETGEQLTGPSSMRIKWYIHQFQPRTYYAMGGTAYFRSRYLSKPFTNLCNRLVCTRRILRTEPNRLRYAHDITCFAKLYDYSSFTSQLREHRYFLLRLSDYCKGTIVTLLDECQGVIEEDLGALIGNYALEYIYPTYEFSGCSFNTPFAGIHNLASFLGTYGNIMGACFLHGAVMLQLCNSVDELNVAGDDGILLTTNSSEQSFWDLSPSLGMLQPEKVDDSRNIAPVHLKRELVQRGNSFHLSPIFRSLSFENQLRSEDIDERYMWCIPRKKIFRKARSASVAIAFIKSYLYLQVSQQDQELIVQLLVCYYTMFNLPLDGNFPLRDDHSTRLGYVAIIDMDMFSSDPYERLISVYGLQTFRYPLRDYYPFDLDCIYSDEFMSNNTPLLKFLQRRGYIQSVPVTRVYQTIDKQQLLQILSSREPRVFSYYVVKIPLWIESLYINKLYT